MKKSVSVSNLTLNLWLDFVRPSLRAANMLEEVPAKDEWHEFASEVIEAETAEEIAHCMTVACFDAHGCNEYTSLEEAKRMLCQIEVSIKYSTATREALATLHEALAAKIAETLTETTEEPEQKEEETEMKEFAMIEKRITEEAEKNTADTVFYVENGYFPAWAEEHRTDPDRGLKANSTETRFTFN